MDAIAAYTVSLTLSSAFQRRFHIRVQQLASLRVNCKLILITVLLQLRVLCLTCMHAIHALATPVIIQHARPAAALQKAGMQLPQMKALVTPWPALHQPQSDCRVQCSATPHRQRQQPGCRGAVAGRARGWLCCQRHMPAVLARCHRLRLQSMQKPRLGIHLHITTELLSGHPAMHCRPHPDPCGWLADAPLLSLACSARHNGAFVMLPA